MKLGLVQHACGNDPAANLAAAFDGARDARARGATVVCLQELFRTTYFCQREESQAFDLAESIPGPTTAALSAVARELGVTLVTSVFERRAPGLYHNTAVVLGADGALLGVYRKMHIPHDACFYEKFYFAPGDSGWQPIETTEARLGPLVCWDQWYPEAARLAALGGAEVLLYPTAIGWLAAEKQSVGAAQLDAWKTIQRAHAIANGVFVAAVNRVGVEDALEFWGHSFVVDPLGRVLAEAGEAPEVLVVDCDLSLIESTRRDWPFFRDRRPDAYAGLGARWLGER